VKTPWQGENPHYSIRPKAVLRQKRETDRREGADVRERQGRLAERGDQAVWRPRQTDMMDKTVSYKRMMEGQSEGRKET
jgi:hypothetical protein